MWRIDDMTMFLRHTILVSLFLVACQPINSDQIPPKITPTLPLTPTKTFIPTRTLEVIPSNTSTPFDQNPRVIELPRWVRYSFPGGVLALPYGDSANGNPSKVMFVNPDVGEKSFVDLPKEFYYYYWKDHEHIVFFHDGNCDTSPQYISDLNVSDGHLQIYTAEIYPGKILGCYFDPDDEIVRINNSSPEKEVEYIDPSSGEMFQLTDPDDGITDISAQLSPANNFLAVVQFDGDFKSLEADKIIYGNKISIFNLENRQLILQYSEEQGILSEVSFISYSNLAYMRENTPCLIMILSQSKKCIHNIPNRFPDSTIILSANSHEDSTLRFLQFSQQQGGYCSYNINTGGLGCPTDRFSVLHSQIVINYSLSYFGHYLLIEYDSKGCPIPWCDNRESPQIGVIDLYEGELFELVSSSSYYLSGVFRPLRPDPWQPWRW
jgi:hypothetical protein